MCFCIYYDLQINDVLKKNNAHQKDQDKIFPKSTLPPFTVHHSLLLTLLASDSARIKTRRPVAWQIRKALRQSNGRFFPRAHAAHTRYGQSTRGSSPRHYRKPSKSLSGWSSFRTLGLLRRGWVGRQFLLGDIKSVCVCLSFASKFAVLLRSGQFCAQKKNSPGTN